MAKNFKNILIMKPSSLGDVVLALPALSALHRNFPDAKISWFIRPEFAPIIEGHPYVDEVILFDRKFLGKAWWNPKALKALISLISNMRRKKYDAVIDLHNLFRTAVLGWLSGCKKRFGMAGGRECSSIFYTDKAVYNESCVHLVDFYLKIVSLMGTKDLKVEFVFPEDKTSDESVKQLLNKNGIQGEEYIVLVPGSAREYKCWPVERFAELADKLAEKYDFSILTVGTKSEKTITLKLKDCARNEVIDLAGVTSLRELIAILNSAALVVSNDTGPGHIAGALDRPVVLIFGQSNPARVAPYARMECVAAIDAEKRGLGHDIYLDKYSVDEITVEQVYEKSCEQIERYRTNKI